MFLLNRNYISTAISTPPGTAAQGASARDPARKFCDITPARDAKQCEVRILKEKVERTQNHQWLQARKTRAILVVKAWCSFKVVSGRRDARLDSASSLCEALCRRSSAKSPCCQVLCRSCCARSPRTAICKRRLQEISAEVPCKICKGSQSKIFVQALF